MIHKAVGGDLFEIDTAEPYPADYYVCIEIAKKQLHEGARPALKSAPQSLSGYDAVFLGYPNWWGTMPMAVCAFLERYDWNGKHIFPFCTNEGSGMGSSVSDIKKLCAGADVADGLSITGHRVQLSEKEIGDWATAQIEQIKGERL